MILDCPSCTRRFKIGDTALGAAGRKVKCSACGHVWHQVPPEGAVPARQKSGPAPSEPIARTPEATPAPEVFDTIAPSEAEHREPELRAERMHADVRPLISRRPAPSHAGGWLAVAALVVALLGGAFLSRDAMLGQWPQARALYAAVFLAPADPTEGLEIRALSSERLSADGVETLVIEGEIVNRSALLRRVPPMRVVLRDVDSRDLVNWTFTPTEATLLPNEIVTFRATRSDPPPDAADAALSFASVEPLPEG